MSRNRLLWLFVLGGVLFLAGCARKEDDSATPAAEKPTPVATAPSATAPPVAQAGKVEGVVTFEGTDPDALIVMTGDPACARLHPTPAMSEAVAAENGKLANVFVYVKSGLEGQTFPVPTEARSIMQRRCLYTPRVVGVQVGQPLRISNSDETLHNVHLLATTNPEINEPQPKVGLVLEKTFEQPEVMMHLKCDVHPWMNAWVGVLPHPYYTVTGAGGAFEIGNLAPGTYTVAAWHESLGTQEQQVTVPADGKVALTFDFKG